MHRIHWVALCATLLVLTACENKAARQQAMHGTWVLDAAGYKNILIETLRKAGHEPGAADLGRIDAEAGGRQMEYEFRGGGEWSASGTIGGTAVTAKGVWWYDGGQYWIRANEENGKAREGLTEPATLKDDVLIIETYTGPIPFKKKS